MPILKLLLCWLAMSITFFAFALISKKELDSRTRLAIVAGSGLLTALAFLSASNGAPLEFRQLSANWLRNLVFFSLLINFFRGPSRQESIISGLVFATTLLILEILV